MLSKYALWVFLAVNAGVLLSQIDMQMVVFLLGTEAAGYYANYLSIIRIPFILLTPGIVFLFPVISDLFAKEKYDKIALIKSLFSQYFFILGLISGAMFLLLGTDITTLLFSDKFETSGHILAYSAPFLFFNFLLQIHFQILSGTGQVKERMWILMQSVVLNTVLNVLFIRYMHFTPQGIVW